MRPAIFRPWAISGTSTRTGYLEMVRSEIPSYDHLQGLLADATAGVQADAILDLGSGTGVTAEHVLAVHPHAVLTGIDSSPGMLAHARAAVPAAKFLVRRLEEELPDGPFDLVVSAFAIHHLDGPSKAALFRRVAAALRPHGRFVFCDVVIPEGPALTPVPLEAGVDDPSRMPDLIAWLSDAGLEPVVVFAQDDLCIVAGDRRA